MPEARATELPVRIDVVAHDPDCAWFQQRDYCDQRTRADVFLIQQAANKVLEAPPDRSALNLPWLQLSARLIAPPRCSSFRSIRQ
ncbi:MAG TPA: hypothetical protein VMR50_09260 [Myxococcota bacterium]|nr:hypothetical protein [Myxococcota bacterium]